jgi:hypothetical protein
MKPIQELLALIDKIGNDADVGHVCYVDVRAVSSWKPRPDGSSGIEPSAGFVASALANLRCAYPHLVQGPGEKKS